MLKAMKKRYLRWKKRKENQKDWSKVTWTPAQVRGSKRTAKAADKAETAEVVSDYVAEKAEKGERIRKGKAMRIWAEEKRHKAAHKHLSKKGEAFHAKKKKKTSVKKASAALKAAVKKEAKRAKKAVKKAKKAAKKAKDTVTLLLQVA